MTDAENGSQNEESQQFRSFSNRTGRPNERRESGNNRDNYQRRDGERGGYQTRDGDRGEHQRGDNGRGGYNRDGRYRGNDRRESTSRR